LCAALIELDQLQLQEIKAVTGGKGRVEDDSVASNKPLAEILREQKEAKDAKFQDQWKQMKTVRGHIAVEVVLNAFSSEMKNRKSYVYRFFCVCVCVCVFPPEVRNMAASAGKEQTIGRRGVCVFG